MAGRPRSNRSHRRPSDQTPLGIWAITVKTEVRLVEALAALLIRDCQRQVRESHLMNLPFRPP
jgi:hypothetical protein